MTYSSALGTLHLADTVTKKQKAGVEDPGVSGQSTHKKTGFGEDMCYKPSMTGIQNSQLYTDLSHH